MDYSKYALIDPKTITLPAIVRSAWERYRLKYNTLPDAVKEAYYREFLASVSKLDVGTWWRSHPITTYHYPSSSAQVQEISRIVDDNVQAYLYETMGMNLDKDRIKELVKKGILSKTVKKTDFPSDIYRMGRVLDLLEQGLDVHDAKRMAGRNPLTALDEVAIEHIRERSCNAVSGLGNAYSGKVKDVVVDKNRQFLRDMMVEGKKKLMTDQEISSAVGHATQDWARDLFRIMYTEGHTGAQYAVANDILVKFGTHPVTGEPMRVKVAKMPEKDACKYCFELYTETDGSLKWFYLDELFKRPLTNEPYVNSLGETIKRYASKIGDIIRGWLAVIGATHPYCRCRLVRYFEMLHNRKAIEKSIAEGKGTEQELNAVNTWREARKEA